MRSSVRHRNDVVRRAALVLALASSTALIAFHSATSLANRPARAHAAHTLDGKDTAHLRLVHQHESTLYEEGPATGSLPGHVRAELKIGATFTGRVTIDTKAGAIVCRGTATPHRAGRYQSFSGSLTVVGGSGRYAHIHGHGGLYGTFDRRTYALVVQTTGSFVY